MRKNKALRFIFFLICLSLFVYQNILFFLAYREYPTARSGAFKVLFNHLTKHLHNKENSFYRN